MSELNQNTPEWQEFRRNKVGASDAPIIMEVSPWKTPFQLWEEKVGLRQNEVTPSMQRGTDMEPLARSAFENEVGFKVTPKVKTSDKYDWMIASLDGIDDTGKNIVEIKCPGKLDHAIALEGEIPAKYFPQLQHQMFVAQVTKAYYFSYTPESYQILELSRDDHYIATMIYKELEFYHCLKDFIAPKFLSRDYHQREDLEWATLSSMYLDLKEKKQSISDEEERIRNRLIAISGNRNAIGGGLKLLKIIRKGNVDYSKIPELKDVDLDKYRNGPVESWRIDAT